MEKHDICDSGCGLFFIKKLCEIGITTLKVAGRGKEVNNLIEDITSIKKALSFIDQDSQNDYMQKILDEFFEGQCKNSYAFCYYPQRDKA